MELAQTLYSPVTRAELSGVEEIPPEAFIPMKGTILVVVADPEEKTKGGIHLPDTCQERPNIARVAAVPDDPDCPVSPGDFVLYRRGQFVPLRFAGRSDLTLLQYTDGVDSELLGVIDTGQPRT